MTDRRDRGLPEVVADLTGRCKSRSHTSRAGSARGSHRPEPPRVWTQPPDGHPFRPLQVMCDDWAAEFEERFARCAGGVDPGLARVAMMLFRELPRSARGAVLLCTDLHGGNILTARLAAAA